MKGLMEGQYAYETLTVEAYFEKSYEKALKCAHAEPHAR